MTTPITIKIPFGILNWEVPDNTHEERMESFQAVLTYFRVQDVIDDNGDHFDASRVKDLQSGVTYRLGEPIAELHAPPSKRQKTYHFEGQFQAFDD